MPPTKMARKSYVTFGDTENNISRLSSSRCMNRRTRTSIVPQYSFNFNVAEETIQSNLVNEMDQNDALITYVMSPFWNIYRVSPLNNLQYNQAKLKQYASKLKQYLTCNVQNKTVVVYDVQIKIIKNLKLEMKHDDALQIKVLTSDKTNNDRCIYEGILLSWCYHTVGENCNSTNLPLLIDKGNKKVSAPVKQWLVKFFDCVITPLSFAQHELLFFVAILSGFLNETDAKPVNFIYDIPVTKRPTTLNLSMAASDLYKIWLSCFPNGEQPSILGEECSAKLYSNFQQFINYVYEIDVGRLQLTILKYPNVTIQNTGKIQLKNISVARAALRILCEMSIILKGPTPRLASEYD